MKFEMPPIPSIRGVLLFLPALLVGLAIGCKPAAEKNSAPNPNTIRIGETSSMTGETAGLGQFTHMGALLAVEEINRQGGVLGKPLELFLEDTRSRAGETATAVRKLTSRDHVVALVGEGASGRCLEAAPIAAIARVPMVSPSATDPRVTEGSDYTFRVCFTDPFQGTIMAKFARESLHVGRVGLLTDVTASYSVGLADFFKRHYVELGGRIVGEQKFAGGNKDFRPQLTALKASSVEAIFAPCYYGDAGLILLQARELGMGVPMLGGDGWEAPELVQVAGNAADGAFFPVHFSSSSNDQSSRDFVQRFEARFHKSPTGVSALAYDALGLIVDSIRRSGSTAGPAIRDALASTSGFTGITGKISIDNERNARKPATIIQVRNGKFEFLQLLEP
jgi:branched-chain amino acid transport system substrate-binding protein